MASRSRALPWSDGTFARNKTEGGNHHDTEGTLAGHRLCRDAARRGAALAQEPIRIGAINPYSGPVALYGDEVARGYQLAIDEANAKGGVIGRKIELLRGDAGNPQQGIAAVEKLVARQGRHLRRHLYQRGLERRRATPRMRYSKIYWDTNALAADLTERGLPNFVRSGPYVGELRRGLGERGARPARARARQADQGAEGLDRKRGFDLRHLDREAPEGDPREGRRDRRRRRRA